MIRTGKRAAQMLTNARLLLAADVHGPVLSARWTLRLLEEKLVELGIVASDNTIGRTLKKTLSSRIAVGSG